MQARGDDVSNTSCVYGQLWSKAEHFRQGRGRLSTSEEEAAVTTRNVELGFLVPSLPSFRDSQWVGSGMGEWGFPDYARASRRVKLNGHL